jgi:YegS/Rv2252/BmrU family lipid kinase
MRKRNERILVVLNPSSGIISKDVATSVIFKKLRTHFNTVSLINSNSPSHGSQITRQALEQFDIITAFGGDGTINSIASALLNTDKILGILPGGSGNGMVRNLGIPLSWRRALDILINGEDVVIDAGRINDQLFFNIAGIGLDGLIAKKFNTESKTRGIAPYVYYTLKGYLEKPTFRVRISLGDTVFQDEITLVAFANFKQYGSNVIIAPFASPYDKQLDICILNKFKLLKESINFPYLFTGGIHKFPFYKTFKFETCEITSLEGEIPFHFDGEYGGRDYSRYTVNVLPARLKVRVPPPAESG